MESDFSNDSLIESKLNKENKKNTMSPNSAETSLNDDHDKVASQKLFEQFRKDLNFELNVSIFFNC